MTRSTFRVATTITAVLTTLAVVTACSSSGTAGGGTSSPAVGASTGTRSSHAPTARKSATVRSSARSSAAASQSGALSGTWHGTYSGGFSGTFTLKWIEGGARLHGTIVISNPSRRMPLNGTLSGSKITFGTVGSTAITYSGTVASSDASMSGSYDVGSQPAGSWSATKA